MREKLIELIKNWMHIPSAGDGCKNLADYLLNNGIVVLPCKCNECSHRCESTNECTLYGRICKNGYCDRAEKALERSKAE